MKIIIAGSRTIYPSLDDISNSIESFGYFPEEVVSGGAIGVDQEGEKWARANNVPMTQFLPDWLTFKKAAGFFRNQEMATYADGLIAFWDGKSRGTKNMIETMEAMGKPAHVIIR